LHHSKSLHTIHPLYLVSQVPILSITSTPS
jgi:hypothetical protein